MKLSHWLFALVIGAISFTATGIALGQSSTLLTFIVANTVGFERFAVQVPVNLSSVSLVSSGYMEPDGLNTNVSTGGVDIGYMPGSDRIRILACFNDSVVNESTECNDATVNDVTLPVAGTGVYEFAADNQFRHLWFNIGVPAVAVWNIEWQYYDGTSYIAFDNVGDGTSNFTVAGLHSVAWSFPNAGAWPLATLHGIEGYWIRAEIITLTSLDQAPSATQVWYETGRWWSLAERLGETEQQQFDIQLGLGSNPRDFHYYFPHTDGIVVADDATIEVTSPSIRVFRGYFDVTAPITGTKSIAFKDGSMEITIPADGIIQVQVYP